MKILKRAAFAAACAAVGIAAAASLSRAHAAATVVVPPTLSTVREVGSYEAVGPVGYTGPNPDAYFVYAAGAGATRSQLYHSADEAQTFQPCGGPNGSPTFPNEVVKVNELRSGTLVAWTDGGNRPWRSADGCATWQPVRVQVPGSSPASYAAALPFTAFRYQILRGESVADDGTYAYMGTYNLAAATTTTNTNYIYRSGDDFQTLDVSLTTNVCRHIHKIAADPGGPLYVSCGDSGAAAGLFVSNDHGVSMQQVCAGRPDALCTNVSGQLVGGKLVTSSDVEFGGNSIDSIDLATGVPSVLLTVPYSIGSSITMPDGSVLLASWFEPGGGVKWSDTSLHVYAYVAGALATAPVLSRLIPAAAITNHLWGFLDIVRAYPNGDVLLYRSGYGSIVAHFESGQPVAPPQPPPPPTTTTTAATACT